jgi:hypothetical protein
LQSNTSQYTVDAIVVTFIMVHKLRYFTIYDLRFQWPRGLRRGSAAGLLAGIAGSKPAGGFDVCLSVCLSLVSVVYCEVQISASGRPLV